MEDTGRLFITNISYTCTEEDLQKVFGKFGPISEVHIPIDKETKKSKGYAYVMYLMPEHAVIIFFRKSFTIFLFYYYYYYYIVYCFLFIFIFHTNFP